MAEYGSEWKTSEMVNRYLRDVRGALPGAELQLAVIARIVRSWCDQPTYILDLGCGDGILGRMLLEIFPAAHGIFVDFSDPMLAAAREKLGDSLRAPVVKADFGDPSWRDAVVMYRPIDLVISGLAIHHQPDERKQQLYAEIYHLLSPGGVFLNLEHVSSSTRAGEQLFDECFIDHLYDFHRRIHPGMSRDAVADSYYHRPDKRENKLAPLDRQCDWLHTIGFRNVDCFCKVFDLAVFGGRKAG